MDVPGASAVLRGGVVAYATDLKGTLLEVDSRPCSPPGVRSTRTSRVAMALGVRSRLGADVGLATTGVAGPDPQDGHAPGTVHVAVATPDGTHVRSLRLDGDRARVRSLTVDAVLALAVQVVGRSG